MGWCKLLHWLRCQMDTFKRKCVYKYINLYEQQNSREDVKTTKYTIVNSSFKCLYK